MNDNNITVYLSSDENLSMSVPDNLTPEQAEAFRANIVELDTHLRHSLDRMTDAVNVTAILETQLLERGFEVDVMDFTRAIRLAREAHERFKNKLVMEENNEESQQ